MNTFVIKVLDEIEIPPIGKCIGTSEDKKWFYYIYRSHQEFKDTNFHLSRNEWEAADLNKENFNFKVNNICPCCGGLGAFYEIPFPKRDDKFNSSGVCYDEDGFVIFGKNVNVYCICNNVTQDKHYQYIDNPLKGTYVGYLMHEIAIKDRNFEELKETYSSLKMHVMNTSTCKTCHGHGETMYNYEHCPECKIPGTRIFIAGG